MANKIVPIVIGGLAFLTVLSIVLIVVFTPRHIDNDKIKGWQISDEDSQFKVQIDENGKEFYISCHCCCPTPDPLIECVYKSKGETLEQIIEEDKITEYNCIDTGCALPVKYVYCD